MMTKEFWIFLLNLLLSVCSPFLLLSLSVEDLSLEEKIGQLLLVHFHGQEANEEAKCLIQEVHIGGIIYYNWANGLTSPQQVQNLSQGLQDLAQKTPHAIPLFIAIDQEGGYVSRLKRDFTVFPGNYALERTEMWSWGEESAWMIGQELQAVGSNLNLAPVVDVYTQPANPVIGIRAFSSDPKQVARWGENALRGYKRAGIMATLKHFPGHGDVQTDSHEALPIVDKKREELDKVELYPFRVLAPQADMIMTAHLLVPALDREQCVTFSKKIVQDLLRHDFNFKGVILTDSLAMEGVLSQCTSLEEAVLKSLEAGHDLILLGGKQLLASQSGLEFTVEDVKRVHRFLVQAVKQGKLSEKRIEASVARILDLKQKYGLFDFTPLTSTLLTSQVNTLAHRTLAQNIARRALDVLPKKQSPPISLSSSLLIVAPDCLQEELVQTNWQTLGSQTQIIYFKGLNPDQATIQEIVLAAKKGEVCLYLTSNAWQFAGQRELFQHLRKNVPHMWVMAVRNPLDIEYFNSADQILCTFSPVAYSLQAAFDHLNFQMGKNKISTSREWSD